MTRNLAWSAAIGGLAALIVPAAAQAFCGTYVGEAGAELTSGASKVVMVRDGNRTVLTLANDVEGSVKDFAVVIPVPEVLSEEDVRVLDPAILDTVAEYSGPRLVTYQCSDFAYDEYYADGANACFGCNGDDAYYAAEDTDHDSNEQALDVTVEAEFAAGEYDIVILSSEDSEDLLTWLNQEGYGVTAEARELLGEYIEGGSKFMAAKVRLDDVPTSGGFEGRPYLSPLQIAYASEAFSLPIRLGTVNSPGEQDLVVYAITTADQGSVGIANYDEFSLSAATFDNECLFDEETQGSLTEYIDGKMDAAIAANDGAAWTMTYTWSPSWCDPCPPGGSLDDETVAELGFEKGVSNAHFPRLWMRYSAEAATQDLVLYAVGGGSQEQLRYIVRSEGLEQYFPVCEEGWADPEDYESCSDQLDEDTGQASLGGPWWLGFAGLGLLTGLGVALRRRRQID